MDRVSYGLKWEYKGIGKGRVNVPEANCQISCIHSVVGVVFLDLVQVLMILSVTI